MGDYWLFQGSHLIIYITGIMVSFSKIRYQKQPAILAIIVYSILTFILVTKIGYELGYLTIAAFLVGIFLGREDTGGSYRQPIIVAGISILLIAIPSIWYQIFGYSPFLRFISFICSISAELGLLIALYGWRDYSNMKPLVTQEVHASAIPAVASGVDAAGQVNPAEPGNGVFDKEDFLPFAVGVMVLGGLFIVPVVYGVILDIEYQQAILSSLISSGIFLYAHDQRGNFSFIRFMGGFLFVLFIIVRAAAEHRVENNVFLAGGIVGFILMYACGWASIAIARFFRRKFSS